MGILQKYHVSCYFMYEKQVSKHNIKSNEYFLMPFFYTQTPYTYVHIAHIKLVIYTFHLVNNLCKCFGNKIQG